MKKIFSGTLVLAILIGSSCNDSSKTSTTETSDSSKMATDGSTTTMANDKTYVDLNTGQNIQIALDSTTHVTTDVISGKPVQIYVNTITSDTFDTQGRLVNNALIHSDAGWQIDETKVKMEDGDMKMKDGDTKLKTEDGDTKLKTDDGKVKTEGDKSKVKTDDVKIKNSGDEIKVKDK